MKQVELIRVIKKRFPEREITAQHLNHILNGRRRPSWALAKVLADITGTDPDFWMDKAPDDMRDMVRNS